MEMILIDSWIILILVVVVGLALGSFITMLSYRLPHNENIVTTRSHCTSCNHPLGVIDLAPLFSWLGSLGKCRYCQNKISLRYPLIELATLFICLLIYQFFGLNLTAFIYLGISLCLLTMIVTDFEHYIIPDSLQIILLCLVVALAFLTKPDYTNMFFGSALGVFTSLALRYLVSRWKKQDSLGIGDVKFIGIAGLFLGAKILPFFFFIAGVIGILTGWLWRVIYKTNIFPFGPALALSMFICMLYPHLNDHFNYYINSLSIKLL